MSRPRPVARWLGAGLTLLLAALLVANLPFYAGASHGLFEWRMEHGRLTLEGSTLERVQPFWVAPNAEGLRWLPAGRFETMQEWSLTVPLWIPLLVCLAWTVRVWRVRPRGSAR